MAPAAAKRGRRTSRRSASVARALISTVAVMGIGFAVGLLVGALWETPDRVLSPFGPGRQVVSLPEVLADPTGTTEAPAGADLQQASVLRGPAPALPRAESPPVAAPPPPQPETGSFSVQVASFTEPVPAWKLAEQLGEKDYEVYVDEGDAAGKPRWRVRVGPVPSRDEADRLALRLKAREQLPTWVLREEEGE